MVDQHTRPSTFLVPLFRHHGIDIPLSLGQGRLGIPREVCNLAVKWQKLPSDIFHQPTKRHLSGLVTAPQFTDELQMRSHPLLA